MVDSTGGGIVNAVPPIRCVLFDLDGTLLDTAPDMAAALNALRGERGLAPLPAERIRPHVSNGAAALVRLGFPGLDGDAFETHRLRFLALYAERICVDTALFDGAEELLHGLESAGLPWGIVTNKPGWLTDPLLAQMQLDRRAASIVSGDTLATRKPDPAPLHHAAAQIGVASADCVYLGDAERDMVAARSAGMRAVFARHGYFESLRADLYGAELGCDDLWDFARWLGSRTAAGTLA
ncbi:MAG: phosphoglycolate phosphatase [Steroidobacteraceae bacterium]